MSSTEKRLHTAALHLFAQQGSTKVTMQQLAEEAGVARGTLYRNARSTEQILEQARSRLVADLHGTIARELDARHDVDPPLRLCTAIRLIVRRAHDDPTFGRFLVRFGLTDESLREALTGPPREDIEQGIRLGRYAVEPSAVLSVVSLVIGTVISAMWMVLEGHQTWREAGSTAAELVVCALGLSRDEARQLASAPLPDL